MSDFSEKSIDPEGSSYVLSSRDYSDIVHLEDATVVERILSHSRSEATAYVCKLLETGVPKYALAGPHVALTAMTVQALTDFWREVSCWLKEERIPSDFSARKWGYQSWVELLREIDSDPVDSDRLRALKAMFLAVNKPGAQEGQQILAYQLFQIAKKLSSGDLLVLRAAFSNQGAGHDTARNWLATIANFLHHGVTALVEQHERVLVSHGLLSPRMDHDLRVSTENGRLTDLGLAFCRNIDNYVLETPQD